MIEIFKKWYLQTWKRVNSYKLKKLKTFDLEISFDDLFSSGDDRKVDYFLGSYSRYGIEYALKKFNIYSTLNKLGFKDIKLVTQLNNPYKQRIALYNIKIDPLNLVAELVTHKKSAVVESFTPDPGINGRYTFLAIEWLCLQNPYAKEKSGEMLLPGQKYPGLGIGRRVLSILYLMTEHLKLDGVFNIPEYYHNAAMYSKKFHFIDPEKEGILQAIKSNFGKTWELRMLSRAIDRNFLYINNLPFKWFSSPQIIPVNAKLRKYFKSVEYNRKVRETIDQLILEIDKNGFMDSLKRNSI